MKLKQSVIGILIIIVISLAGCAKSNTIIIKDDAPWYSPTVLEVDPGETVTWESMAAIVHPVNTLSGPEPIASGHFTKTYSYTFTQPGIYHYYCPLHPYMQGFVVVGDEELPKEKIPKWLNWPPESAAQAIPGPIPNKAGKGEVWLDAQFHKVDGKEKPGTIIVINAQTWKINKIIDDKRLNNPHNMWLSDDRNYVLQTNWFDNYLSIIDKYSGLLIKHLYVGESPAHVMTAKGKIYVTLQGADGMAVLDGANFALLNTIKMIEREHGHDEDEQQLGRGPHGHWVDAKEELMAIAHTEGSSISVWNISESKRIFEFKTDPLPLFAGISADGNYAWTASLLTGKFYAFDVQKKELIKEFVVGKSPIQAVPSPDGSYILVALSGDSEVAILNASTFDVIKRVQSGAGAHGIIYGPKESSGIYAYVSNKFVPWITVIDMDSLEVAGYVPLPKDALGGQGILAVYDE